MGREEGDWHRDGNKHGDCDGDRDMDKDRDSDSTCSRNQSRRSGVKSNCSLSSTAGKKKHGETWLWGGGWGEYHSGSADLEVLVLGVPVLG